MLTQADVENYGEEFIDLTKRAAAEAVSPRWLNFGPRTSSSGPPFSDHSGPKSNARLIATFRLGAGWRFGRVAAVRRDRGARACGRRSGAAG
jgi:hypothetical protein